MQTFVSYLTGQNEKSHS